MERDNTEERDRYEAISSAVALDRPRRPTKLSDDRTCEHGMNPASMNPASHCGHSEK